MNTNEPTLRAAPAEFRVPQYRPSAAEFRALDSVFRAAQYTVRYSLYAIRAGHVQHAKHLALDTLCEALGAPPEFGPAMGGKTGRWIIVELAVTPPPVGWATVTAWRFALARLERTTTGCRVPVLPFDAAWRVPTAPARDLDSFYTSLEGAPSTTSDAYGRQHIGTPKTDWARESALGNDEASISKALWGQPNLGASFNPGTLVRPSAARDPHFASMTFSGVDWAPSVDVSAFSNALGEAGEQVQQFAKAMTPVAAAFRKAGRAMTHTKPRGRRRRSSRHGGKRK